MFVSFDQPRLRRVESQKIELESVTIMNALMSGF